MKFLVFFSIFHLVISNPNTDFGCPNGFDRIDNECYHFSKETATWYEAMKRCKEMNSNLLSVETIEESCAIKIHVHHLNITENIVYWMSGSDEFKEGEWVWMSNWSLFSFTDWCPGEPTNTAGNEHCLFYAPKYATRTNCWLDVDCNTSFWYICEFDPLPKCEPN